MGVERRLKERARVGRAMARPSDMKNKRKEVEVVEFGEDDEEDEQRGARAGVSEKRCKLNVSCEEGEEKVAFVRSGGGAGEAVGDGTSRSGSLMETVQRILDGRRRKSTRPLPALMGNKAVDLIALHSRVNSMGGYSKVTEAKLWSSISDALGLGLECGPGLKLVFVKYLTELETDRCSDEVRGSSRLDASQPSSSELRTQYARSSDWWELRAEPRHEENVHQQREVLNGMMEWIKRVALCPGDPTAGLGTPDSGQDDDWVNQCQMLTARVRSVLWKEPRGGDSSMQAKQMPSQYYDEPVRPDSQTLERLRVTRERLAQYGFQPPPGPNHRGGTSNHQDRNDGSYWGTPGAYVGQRSGRQTINYNDSAYARHNQQRKRIPIGQDFQADEIRWVPRDLLHRSGDTTQDESAGEGPSSSDDDDNDDRWLGVRVWPQPERGGVDSSLRVGRGRAPSCECSEPGSINCVRAHIGAARARLRDELGQAWVEMGFDQMGECVADQWTKDEERMFRLVARTHPASKSSNFWDHLPGAFPFKTRKELNSYYFNVFILRRRALQNRLRDIKIDSDDDEGELPGESDDSGFASTDDEDDDEEDDDLSDGADDAGSEDMPDAYPLRTPNDAIIQKFRPLPDFNYSPTEELVRHGSGRAQIAEEAGNHITDHADDSHIVLVWDDKHLESGSLVRDGVLSQEWQEPHWDGREHQQEAVSSRQLSPPTGKDTDVRQASALGDLWSQNMEMAPKREKDRLLSTNGMILELFGDDVRN